MIVTSLEDVLMVMIVRFAPAAAVQSCDAHMSHQKASAKVKSSSLNDTTLS